MAKYLLSNREGFLRNPYSNSILAERWFGMISTTFSNFSLTYLFPVIERKDLRSIALLTSAKRVVASE